MLKCVIAYSIKKHVNQCLSWDLRDGASGFSQESCVCYGLLCLLLNIHIKFLFNSIVSTQGFESLGEEIELRHGLKLS